MVAMVNPSSGQGMRRRHGFRRNGRAIPGHYLVVLRGTDDPEVSALMLAGSGRGRVRRIYHHAIRGFAIETSEAVARALAQDPSVAYVEEDGMVHVVGRQSLAADDSWGLDRIDQRRAAADGSYDGVYRYAADGSGVHVYVVDTGIRTTHAEFGGRAISAFDGIGDGNGERDCHGHGTHVAGTVGGARFGVAKRVTLYSVRAMDCDGSGSDSGLAEAIDWITANHASPAVINMSIGGLPSDTVDDAIRGAIAAGITFVGAAGNDSEDSCVHLMGGVPAALVIGASDAADRREWYSNFGRCVDLFAPGANIVSADARDDTGSITMSGTSMAAPHVTGAAALYLQHNPGASPAKVAGVITGGATAGVITDPGAGSPNRLLFTAFLGDRRPPAISLTRPAPGATIRGRERLIASVQDDVEVKQVIFFAGSTQLGTVSRPPYSIEWDSTASPDGTYAIAARAYDLAGNTTTARVSVTVRNHDVTPPRVSVAAEGDRIWPPNGKLVPVRFTGTVSDDMSAIRSVSFAVHDEYGRVQPSGTAVVTNGRFAITVQLEASRSGRDTDGRQYVMTVTAADDEGNQAAATAHAIVAHDRR